MTKYTWMSAFVVVLALCGTASLGCVRQAPAASDAVAADEGDYCPFCKKHHGADEHAQHDGSKCEDPNCTHENCEHCKGKHCNDESCEHCKKHQAGEAGHDHDHEHDHAHEGEHDHDHDHADHDHDHDHEHEHESN